MNSIQNWSITDTNIFMQFYTKPMSTPPRQKSVISS